MNPVSEARPQISTSDGTILDAEATETALREAGIPIARQSIAVTAESARAAAEAIGYPVVLKLISPSLVHKSDAGGVLLGLEDGISVARGAHELEELAGRLELDPWHLLVQEQVPAADLEILVGFKRDPTFGPVVLVGAGGRLVELLDDVAMRRCPINTTQARELLADTRVGSAAGGYRGARTDLDALAQIVSELSLLADRRPEFQAVDLNPIVPRVNGSWAAVDARIVTTTTPSRVRAASADRVSLVRSLLEARSVVVLGVSTSDEEKPGRKVLSYLIENGYQGTLYVVHPTAQEIDGIRAYPSIGAVPEESIDLACLAIPAGSCAEALRECGSSGVRTAMVLTSGFAESGDDTGERELVRIARSNGVGLCGPNTVGIISPRLGLHACFSRGQEMRPASAGGIAIVAQSGALGGSLLSRLWARGLGLSRFISVGNQADLNVADYLSYLAEDNETSVVGVLLESAPDGDALAAALERLQTNGKPMVMLKVGRSEAGNAAALSHTGSLAGDARVYDAVLAETGARSVRTITGLLDAVQALALQPRARGRRVGIVSSSGGACGIAADLCDEHGLEIPALDESDIEQLEKLLPAFVEARNPVDTSAQTLTDTTLLSNAVQVLLDSSRVDVLILVITTVVDPHAVHVAEALTAVCAEKRVPVVVAWTVAGELARGGRVVLERAHVPVYPDIDRAVSAAAALVPARSRCGSAERTAT